MALIVCLEDTDAYRRVSYMPNVLNRRLHSQLIHPKLTKRPQNAPVTVIQACRPPSGGGPSGALGGGPAGAVLFFSGSRASATFWGSAERGPFSSSSLWWSLMAGVE